MKEEEKIENERVKRRNPSTEEKIMLNIPYPKPYIPSGFPNWCIIKWGYAPPLIQKLSHGDWFRGTPHFLFLHPSVSISTFDRFLGPSTSQSCTACRSSRSWDPNSTSRFPLKRVPVPSPDNGVLRIMWPINPWVQIKVPFVGRWMPSSGQVAMKLGFNSSPHWRRPRDAASRLLPTFLRSATKPHRMRWFHDSLHQPAIYGPIVEGCASSVPSSAQDAPDFRLSWKILGSKRHGKTHGKKPVRHPRIPGLRSSWDR